MNIDRPLDELVQESRNAKRAARAEKRKNVRQTRKVAQGGNTNAANANGTPAGAQNGGARVNDADNKLAPPKRRMGIAKKRRGRRTAATAAAAALDEERDAADRGHAPVSQRLSAPAPAARKGPRPSNKGVKVAVSNLHPGVTEADIAELFETVGPLRSARLRSLPDGRSACDAEVIFDDMQDALDAIKKYNMVPLDNQPLHITLATDSINTRQEPVQARVGRQRARGPGNARKSNPPADSAHFEEEDNSPSRGNGFNGDRNSPQDDRAGGNGGSGQGRRQNRRRYNNRRYHNKPGNGNGNGNGADRDGYAD